MRKGGVMFKISVKITITVQFMVKVVGSCRGYG